MDMIGRVGLGLGLELGTGSAAGYQANTGAAFGGTSEYLDQMNGSSITANQTLLMGFWSKMDEPAADVTIMHSSGSAVWIYLESSNEFLEVRAENSGGSLILRAVIQSAYAYGQWNHHALSANLADSGDRWGAHNGSTATVNWAVYTDDTIAWNNAEYAVGGTTSGGSLLNGALQEVYLANQRTAVANLSKFVSGGKPQDLGETGSGVTGTAPPIYLNDPFDTFQDNKGSLGGSFAEKGTLTDEGTRPSL